MIQIISYRDAIIFLKEYHYLEKNSSKSRSGINYGLFIDNELVGVCIYHHVSSQYTNKSMLYNPSHKIVEMGRLCLDPKIKIKNILSSFVANTFKDLKINHKEIDYVLTYADSDYHSGKIYQALSLSYHGTCKPQVQFYIKQKDGTYKKRHRERVKGVDGYYIKKSKKHRYIKCLKKGLKKNIKWKELSYCTIDTKNKIFNHTQS